ncbi:DMT family transporter [Dolichospermum sp. UHCC 0259]|uniref:DMT family transporter n=1 Tax=Dolichospermum sp. UHCC 0259 TaxID=2590010 RepID=UPI0014453CF1|nr:DMT family transporter [Dolichospermum sp. UHCC 0259]MTJ47020.1 DMT family transporter [Dolichospermum sp. UHCC 0259]
MSVLSDASPEKLPIKSEDLWSFISLLGSLIAFSFVPVFTKWGAMETSSGTAIFDRFFLTTIILGLIWGLLAIYRQLANCPNQSPPLSPPLYHRVQLLGLFLVTGNFLAGMLITLAWSLGQTTVANCELINNLTPVFTVLGGWLLFKQCFDRRFLIGCAIAVSGLLIVGFNDFQIGIDKLQGDFLALASALFLAAYLLGAEQLRTQLQTDTVLLGCFACGTPLTLMVLVITHENLLPTSLPGWIAIVSMSVSGLLAQGLLLYSLKRLSSGFVALVFLLTPFTTAIIAGIMFSETLSLSNLLAFCVVVLGLSLSISSSSGVKEIEESV